MVPDQVALLVPDRQKEALLVPDQASCGALLVPDRQKVVSNKEWAASYQSGVVEGHSILAVCFDVDGIERAGLKEQNLVFWVGQLGQ